MPTLVGITSGPPLGIHSGRFKGLGSRGLGFSIHGVGLWAEGFKRLEFSSPMVLEIPGLFSSPYYIGIDYPWLLTSPQKYG